MPLVFAKNVRGVWLILALGVLTAAALRGQTTNSAQFIATRHQRLFAFLSAFLGENVWFGARHP